MAGDATETSGTDNATEPADLLTLHGLTKRYGPVTVVDGCSLSFRGGEVHALLGANGAGKSTLVRMISGLVEPSAGTMTLGGTPYQPAGKRAAETAGVEIVQQELNLIPTLSVAENLRLARLPARGGIIRRGELRKAARVALDRFRLTDIDPDTKVGTLGVGRRQMVEIAAALDRECRLLILDEPTAALSAAESEALFDWLGRLRDRGVGLVYISHRLDEVARLADRVSVLRDGRHVGTYPAAECPTDRMVELMSGESSAQGEYAGSLAREETVLRVANLSGGPVRDVSFEVKAGERLGIAGLVGSGRTELLRLVFGADIAVSGAVHLRGSVDPRRFRHPREAVAAGLAMVTEDRKQNGLLLPHSIGVNASLASLGRLFSRGGVLRKRAEAEAAERQVASLDVRCRGIGQPVGTLSGGNQQKVAVAKWLVRTADVFLFDEPTRGIDVAARRRIYRLLDSLAAEGKGIVVVSSDLDELLEVCDRIAVMSAGRLVETFTRDDWSADRMMKAAFSGYRGRRQTA